jgi:hypothetical protein
MKTPFSKRTLASTPATIAEGRHIGTVIDVPAVGTVLALGSAKLTLSEVA